MAQEDHLLSPSYRVNFGWSSVGTDVRLDECPGPLEAQFTLKGPEASVRFVWAGLCTQTNVCSWGETQMRCKVTVAWEAWATGVEVGGHPRAGVVRSPGGLPPKVQCTQCFCGRILGYLLYYYLFTCVYLWKHNCVGVGVTSFGDMPGFSDVGSGG